ncbi:RNA polymerase sigma factor [Cryobacterium frigoriphilum]|uniref:RNA polymerase sigma factor n=1 Tax=Cryobacterium frigoriphilum TaxID=1259150 RepID=A0A4R8ZTE6_9MICO|nr:RNA polymerase sigma factor [Cryobacterium frigoriphilum]TFD44739.1 RNA polymerase sigma factor [Cryobacterium frigoriphilum]
MGDEVSDAALWLEAVTGTERAFAVLFDRHRARIFRKAYSRVRNVYDAEDVVAMVFMEAWRSREKVRIVDESLLPWLLSVTTYVTLNSDRAARRYRRLLSKLPVSRPVDPVPDIDDRLDQRERANQLTRALRRLGSAERTVVDLCLVEELSMSAVAGVLDIPIGTVKSRLNSARRKLRTYLGESDISVHTANELTAEGISGWTPLSPR